MITLGFEPTRGKEIRPGELFLVDDTKNRLSIMHHNSTSTRFFIAYMRTNSDCSDDGETEVLRIIVKSNNEVIWGKTHFRPVTLNVIETLAADVAPGSVVASLYHQPFMAFDKLRSLAEAVYVRMNGEYTGGGHYHEGRLVEWVLEMRNEES